VAGYLGSCRATVVEAVAVWDNLRVDFTITSWISPGSRDDSNIPDRTTGGLRRGVVLPR